MQTESGTSKVIRGKDNSIVQSVITFFMIIRQTIALNVSLTIKHSCLTPNLPCTRLRSDPGPLECVSDPLRSGAPSSWAGHAREVQNSAVKAIAKNVCRTKTTIFSEEEQVWFETTVVQINTTSQVFPPDIWHKKALFLQISMHVMLNRVNKNKNIQIKKMSPYIVVLLWKSGCCARLVSRVSQRNRTAAYLWLSAAHLDRSLNTAHAVEVLSMTRMEVYLLRSARLCAPQTRAV